MFEDKTLVCKDCGKEFVWTADSAASRTTRGSLERVFFILSTCNRPDNKPRPGGKAGARNGTFNSVYMQKRVNQPFSFILAKHSLQ